MLKSILNVNGVQLLSKKEQKDVVGGFFRGVPIASTCDFNSFQACLNGCTGPNTECGPCLDNNAGQNTYECRYSGFTIFG